MKINTIIHGDTLFPLWGLGGFLHLSFLLLLLLPTQLVICSYAKGFLQNLGGRTGESPVLSYAFAYWLCQRPAYFIPQIL